MKKTKFLVAVTIALATAVGISGCSNSSTAKIPEGTPIGEGLFLVENSSDDGTKTVQLQDSAGYAIGNEYAAVADSNSYLIARKADGTFELLTIKGSSFATAASYEVKKYFATTEATPTSKYIKTLIASNGNHLAYDVATHQKLVAVEGIKEEVLPLDNGYTLFKIKELWGVAKADAEEPIADGAKEITVVTTKTGQLYFWLNTKTGAAIINETGKVIKRMSPAQFKKLKKGGKKLWEESGASAVAVKAI